jgi:hypothetical protein
MGVSSASQERLIDFKVRGQRVLLHEMRVPRGREFNSFADQRRQFKGKSRYPLLFLLLKLIGRKILFREYDPTDGETLLRCANMDRNFRAPQRAAEVDIISP